MEENEKMQEEPHGEPAETQAAEIDWKAEARKWEQRAKENHKRAEELSTAANANAGNADKLREALERAERAEAEAAELNRQKELANAKAQAARLTGVPAEILRGETLEELTEHAEAIKAALPAYRSLHDTGDHSSAPVTKEQILAIKNDKERLAAIKANPGLFQ